MSSIHSDLSDVQLVKALIGLNGLSISKAAKVMDIQRSNLSVWLNGKQKVFSVKKIDGMLVALGMRAVSESSTGMRLRDLSPDIVHRWEVGADAQALVDVLRATESDETLAGVELYQVNGNPTGYFNILRSNKTKGDGWMMLVSNRDPSSTAYPLSRESLGFGKEMGVIDIPSSTWVVWRKEGTLLTLVLGEDLSNLINTAKSSQDNEGRPDEFAVESRRDPLAQCQQTVEGLKAILRAFVDEMGRIDPGNRLLNGSQRNGIFQKYFDKADRR